MPCKPSLSCCAIFEGGLWFAQPTLGELCGAISSDLIPASSLGHNLEMPTIKPFNSEYERIREVAKRLLKPSWVKRYHGGDEEEAARRLANDYGFVGRINYMRQLCNMLEDYPDQDEF